ncbi:MAG: GHKL domain-containing protein [Lachnospiraceae bacterium]|nr:GHKL domain-containing protein [Lachnospiraceae bacterium]MBO6300249.1 GHKL domain-containing protein [Lachnospiraceae bacterium]
MINTILNSGNYTSAKMLFTIILNISLSIILTLFYSSNTRVFHLLIPVVYETFAVLSEFITAVVLLSFHPELNSTNSLLQDSYITLISSIFLFLIVMLFTPLQYRNNYKIRQPLLFLNISTPLFSILFLSLFPFHFYIQHESETTVFFFYLLVLLLNIFNYILLKYILKLSMENEKLLFQSKQLQFQSEKYESISGSYKNIRKLVHEMRRINHFVSLCAEQKRYDDIIDFISQYSAGIEKEMLKINTGNLVIDSLLTSCDSFACQNNIPFNLDLKIDYSDIPIKDYDLCIILGNLLDNIYNEFKRTGSKNEFFIKVCIKTQEHFFVIHTQNPISDTDTTISSHDHGYGIINIKTIVDKYHGSYFQKIENNTFITTIALPIFRDSVGNLFPFDYISSTSTPPRK